MYVFEPVPVVPDLDPFSGWALGGPYPGGCRRLLVRVGHEAGAAVPGGVDGLRVPAEAVVVPDGAPDAGRVPVVRLGPGAGRAALAAGQDRDRAAPALARVVLPGAAGATGREVRTAVASAEAVTGAVREARMVLRCP